MKTTLAEQDVGAENIHKEDAEGKHYQGGEGALSQVVFHLHILLLPLLLKHLFLLVIIVIVILGLFRDDIWCGAVGCVLCDQGERLGLILRIDKLKIILF